MRRTEQAQGLRLMKFEEVYARTTVRLLSQAEAAEILGVSERTFRRWRDRFEAGGAEGLYDRRLGRVSARRAPVDEVARVLALFDTRYWDFTAKHFHEKLVSEHACRRSYTCVRLTLRAHGRMAETAFAAERGALSLAWSISRRSRSAPSCRSARSPGSKTRTAMWRSACRTRRPRLHPGCLCRTTGARPVLWFFGGFACSNYKSLPVPVTLSRGFGDSRMRASSWVVYWIGRWCRNVFPHAKIDGWVGPLEPSPSACRQGAIKRMPTPKSCADASKPAT